MILLEREMRCCVGRSVADCMECCAVELLTLTPPSIEPLPIVSPLGQISNLLRSLSDNLDKVTEYVRQVNAGEREGDDRVGRFLLENVASTAMTDSEGIEDEFNSHLSVR
jgi:hypothetical protein